jgi:AbrB family looped-hinge helix DNA binding protein
MTIAQSRLTAQGQISVPAEIRKRLAVGPGSLLEWQADGDRIIVRRAGTFSSADVHSAVFRKTPKARTLDDMKAGIRRHIKARHARG